MVSSWMKRSIKVRVSVGLGLSYWINKKGAHEAPFMGDLDKTRVITRQRGRQRLLLLSVKPNCLSN